MTTLFNMGRDINGYCAFAPMFCEDQFSTTLSASIAQSLVVPSQANNYIAIFSYTPGASVWVSITGTASLPGTSFAPNNSDLNPAARWVPGGATLSFITLDGTKDQVGVSFYALPN